MRIAVPKETAPGERRVALVPESCKKLMQAGYEIAIESGAGVAAGFPDAAYRELGVALEPDPAALLGVRRPGAEGRRRRRSTPAATRSRGCGPAPIYLGSLMPLRHLDAVRALAAAEDHRLRHRRHPAHDPRAVDGHAVVDGQHRRLQRRAARRRRAQSLLPDAHDGRRHGASRPRSSSSAPASRDCRRSPPPAASAPTSWRPTCGPK